MPLSFKDVAEIIKLIDASDCDEVVLELEGMRLVVRRGGSGSAAGTVTSPAGTQVHVPAEPGDAATAASPASAGSAAEAAASETQTGGEAGTTDVRAPMVGTFYRCPGPDEAPFVEEGVAVKKGDPLCLIEVMKLFTTIEAPVDGTVTAIAPADGTLVEFNQLLFRISA